MVGLPSYVQSVKVDQGRSTGSGQSVYVDKPRVNTSFPEVDKLTIDEMKSLLNNEDKLKEFAHSIEAISTSSNLKKELLSSNIETKEKIVNAKQELQSLETEVNLLKQQLEQTREIQNTLTKLQDTIKLKYSSHNLSQYLTEKAQTIDDTSESYGDDFIRGNMTLEDFLNQFQKTRKEFHLAQIKATQLSPPTIQQPQQHPPSWGVNVPSQLYPSVSHLQPNQSNIPYYTVPTGLLTKKS